MEQLISLTKGTETVLNGNNDYIVLHISIGQIFENVSNQKTSSVNPEHNRKGSAGLGRQLNVATTI